MRDQVTSKNLVSASRRWSLLTCPSPNLSPQARRGVALVLAIQGDLDWSCAILVALAAARPTIQDRPMSRLRIFVFACLCVLLASALPAGAEERFITLASTTSTEESGLFGHILPIFRAQTGI